MDVRVNQPRRSVKKNVGVKVLDDKVMVDFDQCIHFLALDKKNALELAKLITKLANEL